MSDQHQRPNQRPPITYETTDVPFANGTAAVRISKAQIAIPRFSLQIGTLRDGRISPFVSVALLDDMIAALTKIRDERVPAFEAEVAKAKADAVERERKRDEMTAQRKVEWQKHTSRGNRREFSGPDDMRKAQRRSERAKREQQRVAEMIHGTQAVPAEPSEGDPA